jgi:hypothetical protein
VRQCGARYAERMKGVPKNEDGDNKGLRLTEGGRLIVASEKDRARRLEQWISAYIWLDCLYLSDSLAS